MQLSDLPSDVISRILAEVREHEPAVRAVLVTGSYARGDADQLSDLDLRAITPAPATPYRSWFEPREGPALHVSLGAGTAEDWRAMGQRPVLWSLGFPAVTTARYAWREAAADPGLGEDPSVRSPAAGPELEDFVEALMKTRRAARAADVLGIRWAAQQAGALTPSLLIPLNPERVVHDRRDALAAALNLEVGPADLSARLTTCLGLNPASAGEIAATTIDLGSSLLAFLREHAPDIDSQPGISAALTDGTLERQLQH
jgi:hypothetical protein